MEVKKEEETDVCKANADKAARVLDKPLLLFYFMMTVLYIYIYDDNIFTEVEILQD